MINPDDPLAQGSPSAARETDFAQLFVKNPHETGKRIFRELAAGNLTDLFIVLRIPAAPLSRSLGRASPDWPQFAGSASRGRSYLSTDGGVTFTQFDGFNRLIASAVMVSGAVRKGGSRFLQARPHL